MENQVHPPGSLRARAGWFLAIWVASVLLCGKALRSLVELSLSDERYSYLVLIPLISAGLLFWNKEVFFRGAAYRLRWGFPGGVPGGVPAILIGFLAYAGATYGSPFRERDQNLTLAILAIAVIWVGGFILCFGPRCARAALFPLTFLLLMIPLPGFVLASAVAALQQASAATSGVLFRALGVPVIRHGLRFSLPGLEIEVAEQCSGIRSSLSLFITGVLASYLLLQSAGKRVLFSLLTIPVAIFKNAVRIVTLSWLGVYVNPGFLHGRLHQYGGLPVSFLALAILAPVVFALRKSEGRFLPHREPSIREAPAN